MLAKFRVSERDPLKLVLLVSAFTIFISNSISYILTFYLSFSTDKALLYNAHDPGYVTPGYKAEPILGVHFWGDLLSSLSFAAYDHAYSASLDYPATYPPLGVLVFRPFVDMNPVIPLAVITFTTIILVFLTFLKFADTEKNSEFWLFCILVLLFSKPFLLTLDRGNLQGIVVSLMILSILHLREGNMKWAIICLVLAICLKGYPVLVILAFLRRRLVNQAIKTLVYSLALSIVAGILVSGPKFWEIPVGLMKGDSVQSGNNKSGLSAAASIVRILDFFGIWRPNQGRNILFLIFAAICALIIVFLLYRYIKSRKAWTKVDDLLIVMLSTFVIPVSWSYNAIWIPFLILAIIEENRTENLSPALNQKYFFITAVMAIINIPLPYLWRGGDRIAVGALELFLFPICSYLYYVRQKERK